MVVGERAHRQNDDGCDYLPGVARDVELRGQPRSARSRKKKHGRNDKTLPLGKAVFKKIKVVWDTLVVNFLNFGRCCGSRRGAPSRRTLQFFLSWVVFAPPPYQVVVARAEDIHLGEDGLGVGVRWLSQVETNGLKAPPYFQGVETQGVEHTSAFNTRGQTGVNLYHRPYLGGCPSEPESEQRDVGVQVHI